jgi:phosphatidylglycerophosphate synthase
VTGKPWDQRLATLLVRPLARTPITPNAMTTIGLGFGLIAAWLFATGRTEWGGLLFVIAVFWDHTDGELARRTGKTSRFGHHYDRAVAFLNYTLGFAGMGSGVAMGGADWALPAGLLSGIAVAGIFALRTIGEQRVGKEFTDQPMLLGFEIEDILYIVGPIAWFGWLEQFLAAAVIGAPLYFFWTLATLYRGRARA